MRKLFSSEDPRFLKVMFLNKAAGLDSDSVQWIFPLKDINKLTSVWKDGPEHNAITLQHAVQRQPGRLRPRDDRLVGRHRNGSHVLRRLAGH